MLKKAFDSLTNRVIALTYVAIESLKGNRQIRPNVFYAEYLKTLEFIESYKG